jgi:protein-S-isoprenylcysteine O-methyltransferase Ste14
VRVRSAVFARLFSWIGAFLFVLSLVYFVLSYLRTFGAIQLDGNPLGAVTWNVTLFTAFALHHSVFARARVRQWLAPIVPPELDRPVYVWIASLLFMLVCAAWRPLPGTAWRADDLAVWALRALQAAGLWLMVRSAAILDIWALAGLRPQAPGPSEFKVQGPYGWIRHPIYAGWFLFVFSASPMTMTRLVFAIVSGAYLLIAIPLEERTIRAATGDAYDRYIAAVRWKLVPGLY